MDDKTTVLGTSGFIDNTIRSHGTHKQYQCIAVLADANNNNKFHVENVDCSKKAKVICRVDLEQTKPVAALPKLPCVKPMSRKKRGADLSQYNGTETNSSGSQGKHFRKSLAYIEILLFIIFKGIQHEYFRF